MCLDYMKIYTPWNKAVKISTYSKAQTYSLFVWRFAHMQLHQQRSLQKKPIRLAGSAFYVLH